MTTPAENVAPVAQTIARIQEVLKNSGYFQPDSTVVTAQGKPLSVVEQLMASKSAAKSRLDEIARFLGDSVIDPLRRLIIQDLTGEELQELRTFLENLVSASGEIKRDRQFVSVYGELISIYLTTLQKCAMPGNEDPVLELILKNIIRRKAIEVGAEERDRVAEKLDHSVCISIVSRKSDLEVVLMRGLRKLQSTTLDYRTVGESPQALAEHIEKIVAHNGFTAKDITDIVCLGGDMGSVPDGTYVLDEHARDVSLKRLGRSYLNRGALVAWELGERIGKDPMVNMSIGSPLSFCTLASKDLMSLFRVESRELQNIITGHVKVAPLKAIGALLAEIESMRFEEINLLVMTLDEVFASVVRKIGSRITREMTAQEANQTLVDFDFEKVVQRLIDEGITIPPDSPLADDTPGAGVDDVCQLISILKNKELSSHLRSSISDIVVEYARQVAMVLEMATAGSEAQRAHFMAISSTKVLQPEFHELFAMIRDRIDAPLTSMLCVNSFEHEYLLARHLFELYVNPAEGESRLTLAAEQEGMQTALQVLGSEAPQQQVFSFPLLLDDMLGAIMSNKVEAGNLVLVGADNEHALAAAVSALDRGLLKHLALIGDAADIDKTWERAELPLSAEQNTRVEVVAIDPGAPDYEAKKVAMADRFGDFIQGNRDFLVMKGSVDTAKLLKKALAIYKSSGNGGDKPKQRKVASHTALSVLPAGRFFALSDPAVNPYFKDSDHLLHVVHNQLDVVRSFIGPEQLLKVAIITAVEKATKAIPETELAAEAREKCLAFEDRYGPIIVEGPISMDIATVPGVAEEKRYGGEIRGDANCLVGTDINAANVMYKMFSKTMGSLGLMTDNGAVITAGPGTVPIVLTSRGDTAETKFNSIVLAFAYLTHSGNSNG